jgi:hypothetical protein
MAVHGAGVVATGWRRLPTNAHHLDPSPERSKFLSGTGQDPGGASGRLRTHRDHGCRAPRRDRSTGPAANTLLRRIAVSWHADHSHIHSYGLPETQPSQRFRARSSTATGIRTRRGTSNGGPSRPLSGVSTAGQPLRTAGAGSRLWHNCGALSYESQRAAQRDSGRLWLHALGGQDLGSGRVALRTAFANTTFGAVVLHGPPAVLQRSDRGQ